MDNPTAYGMPTFEQFARDPDKYFGRKDSMFDIVDKGSTNLNKHVRKHRYKFKQWKAKSLEEIEVIAKDHGFDIDQLEFTAKIVNTQGDKCDILVEFFEKQVKEENRIIAPY